MTADVTADEASPLLAAEINALPDRVRAYIHHLISDADPAGDKWRLAYLEETNAALKAALRTHDAAHRGFDLLTKIERADVEAYRRITNKTGPEIHFLAIIDRIAPPPPKSGG